MKTASVLAFASSVAGHAALVGLGPEKCYTSPRQPKEVEKVQKISGTNGAMDNLQGIRCVASKQSNGSTLSKLNGWCKDAGDWQNTTRDEGFCFGTSKGLYTSDAHDGLPDAAPMLWGHDKDCTWKAGDNIRVAVHVTAQHNGTHFIDFVPQNKEQLDGLPPCPGSKGPDGKVAPFQAVDKRIADFKVCYQDNVNVADEKMEDWQRKTIRLHPAFAIYNEQEAIKSDEYQMKFYKVDSADKPTSGDTYRMEYKFKLPDLKFDAAKPALFRWVWFCGYDAQCACTPPSSSWMHPDVTPGDKCPNDEYVAYGMGEIFINCADIKSVSSGAATEKAEPKEDKPKRNLRNAVLI